MEQINTQSCSYDKKKVIIKSVIFVMIFLIAFLIIQSYFDNKISNNYNVFYTSYQEYKEIPSDSIDVLFLGSSWLRHGISPLNIYHDTGITSYNLSFAKQPALATYYLLKEALNYQTPKVVVIELNTLCQNTYLTDEEDFTDFAKYYQQLFYSLDDYKLEYAMQLQMDNPYVNVFSWYSPLILYHSMWDEICIPNSIEDNTSLEKQLERPSYGKGTLYEFDEFNEELDPLGNDADLSLYPLEYDDYSLEWYKKIKNLCSDKGIKLVVLNTPKELTEYNIMRNQATNKMCLEYNIDFFDYNTLNEFKKLDIKNTDLYDDAHLNIKGCMKLSKAFGEALKDNYDLEDHRNDPEYEQWDLDWKQFKIDYKDYIDFND